MKAIILSAGKGERLGNITRDIPKPMIELDGKPILEHNILICKRSGINDIYINLHYLPDIITNYFGNGKRWGVKIRYKYESELLGTAGGVKNFYEEIGNMPFFIIYGDNYVDFDLNLLKKFHDEKKSDFSIALSFLDNVSQSGVVKLIDNNKIKSFIEKPTANETESHWVNAGIYYIEFKILNEIIDGYSDFGHDVIPLLINNGFNVYGYKLKKKVLAIDTPELLNNSKKEIDNAYFS